MSRRKRRRSSQRGHRRAQLAALLQQQKRPNNNTQNFSVAALIAENMASGRIPMPKPALPVPVRDPEDDFIRARKASEWYVEQARINQRPWFHCIRERRKYSEDILITPEMAEVLLRFNPLNRNQSEDSIEAYRRDIENDRWINTHQGIGIDTNGNMLDGQHRAAAIVAAGKPAVVYVTFNCIPESRYVLDQGQKRSDSQQLRFIAEGVNSKTSSIARAMMRGSHGGKPRYTMSELAEFVYLHNKAIDRSWKLLKGGQRADLYGAFAKAILWYGEDRMTPFAERFTKQLFDGTGDPAHTLWMWLYRIKRDRQISPKSEDVYKKVVCALKAHVQGRRLLKIVARQDDIFDWLPGWQIPADRGTIQPYIPALEVEEEEAEAEDAIYAHEVEGV